MRNTHYEIKRGHILPGVPCVECAVDGANGRGQAQDEGRGALAKGGEGLGDCWVGERVDVEDVLALAQGGGGAGVGVGLCEEECGDVGGDDVLRDGEVECKVLVGLGL